jgi:hypothetical protein
MLAPASSLSYNAIHQPVNWHRSVSPQGSFVKIVSSAYGFELRAQDRFEHLGRQLSAVCEGG